MPSGTVKCFDATENYGFTAPDGGGGRDVFAHISAVEKAGLGDQREGAKLTHDIVANKEQRERGKSPGSMKKPLDLCSGLAASRPKIVD